MAAGGFSSGKGGGGSTNGGGKPGSGLGRYFDKCLYHFDITYHAGQQGYITPPDTRADINNLTPSATSPTHRRSYDQIVGGYYRFAAASTHYFTTASKVADATSQLFVCALVRRRDGTSNNGIVSQSTIGVAGNPAFALYFDDTQIQMTVTNTTPTSTACNQAITTANGSWHLVMGCYTNGTNIKVGIDGAWLKTTVVPAGNLQNKAAIVIGGSGDGAGPNWDGDIAFLGVGTSIPSDRQLKQIYNTLMWGADKPGGVPGDDPGDIPPPEPTGGTFGRLLLLGAG
jgi:hypothetical protein